MDARLRGKDQMRYEAQMTHPLSIFGSTPLNRVDNSAKALKAGEIVVLFDNADRENEGDMILAAEHASAKSMNFMIRYGSGIVALSMAESIADHLELPPMVPKNDNAFQTAFGVSFEAATGITTGVSAADRARSIQAAINPDAKPTDLRRPGHMFPLRAKKGGVLARPGHTEGSVDLAMIAGQRPAAALCEMMNPDGTMSRLPQIIEFCQEHKLTALTVEDLVEYRKERL